MRNTYLILCFGVLFSCVISIQARAADHLDSPSVQADGSTDINDLYAFVSPSNPNNIVLIMTVNPLAGVQSGTTFNNRAVYEFEIDFNGDARAEFAYRFYFARPRLGAQRFLVFDKSGRFGAFGRTGVACPVRGGGTVTAGVFDDPFFFDLAGFNNGLAFTGTDFFAGANVSAIVLEVPAGNIPVSDIAVNAKTIMRGRQVDRMGRPAINTVLIPSEKKNLFNKSTPNRDVRNFNDDVVASLIGLGNSEERAQTLANILLPDVLTFNTSNPAGFLNGRRLEDDVIDAELSLLTNGAVAGDGVPANDVMFLPTFPYLAPAH